VRMCVCVNVCVCVCVCAYTCPPLRCLSSTMSGMYFLDLLMFVRVYLCVYERMCVCLYVCVYLFLRVCVRV